MVSYFIYKEQMEGLELISNVVFIIFFTYFYCIYILSFSI